jgi:surface protein
MYCLITNYNIVNEEVVNGNDYLNIILNNQSIHINLDYKRKIWFNELLGFTCLEIVKEDNLIERLNSFNVNDDCYNKKINNKKCDNRNIKITSVAYNSEVEIFDGNIFYIDNNNSTFYHSCKINPELFCGPILLSNNFSIIGIHLGTKEEKNIGLYFSEIFKNINDDNYIEKVIPDRSRNEFICEIDIQKDNFKGNIVLFKCNEENTNYFDIDKIEVNFNSNPLELKRTKNDWYVETEFEAQGKYIIKFIIYKRLININNFFEDCKMLYSIDVSKVDTSNVTDMELMFKGCKNLRKIIGLHRKNIRI